MLFLPGRCSRHSRLRVVQALLRLRVFACATFQAVFASDVLLSGTARHVASPGSRRLSALPPLHQQSSHSAAFPVALCSPPLLQLPRRRGIPLSFATNLDLPQPSSLDLGGLACALASFVALPTYATRATPCTQHVLRLVRRTCAYATPATSELPAPATPRLQHRPRLGRHVCGCAIAHLPRTQPLPRPLHLPRTHHQTRYRASMLFQRPQIVYRHLPFTVVLF